MDEIVVTKENDNTQILYESSSDGGSDLVQLNRRKYRPIQKTKTPTSQVPASSRPTIRRMDTNLGSKPSDDMLNMFSNPEKQYVPNPQNQEEMGFDQSPPMSEHLSEPMMDDDYAQDYQDEQDYPQPSAGFDTIEDEKQDLLYKFYRMQTKGIPISKKFNMSSDIHDMRREFNKITRDMDVNGSIKFSRRMLMACVTGIEFLNKRYDPFDIKLDGWSESMMESVDDYDNVFERLHDKYASKVQMAPEIELMLGVMGSAFMFHLTNSMMGNLPNLNDIAKSNPDIINNLMKTMSNVQPSVHTPPMTQLRPTTPNTEPSAKKEMKGPMFDMSSVMGMFNAGGNTSTPHPLPPVVPPPMPPMIPPPVMPDNQPVNNNTFESISPLETNTIRSPSLSIVSSSMESEQSRGFTKTISVNESAVTAGSKGRRGRKPKVSDEKVITI